MCLFRSIPQPVSAFSTAKTLPWKQQFEVCLFCLISQPIFLFCSPRLYQGSGSRSNILIGLAWRQMYCRGSSFRWAFSASYLKHLFCFARENRTVQYSNRSCYSYAFSASYLDLFLVFPLLKSHHGSCSSRCFFSASYLNLFCCLDRKNRTVGAAVGGGSACLIARPVFLALDTIRYKKYGLGKTYRRRSSSR